MAAYYLAPQLSDAALDLTHIAGENETLQKLEDIHEILRDATPDDRLLAVRDLTDSVRLSMIHCINTAYRAAPSGFSTEVPALLDEHAEFNRATLCYDGAPDDYRRANELYPKYAELRTADAEMCAAQARHTSKGAILTGRMAPFISPKTARAAPLTCHCPPLPCRYCTRCAKHCSPKNSGFRSGLLLAPLRRSPHRQ